MSINPVVHNRQKRKASRKLVKAVKKGKIRNTLKRRFNEIKDKHSDKSRKRSKNIDDDYVDYRQKDVSESEVEDEEDNLPELDELDAEYVEEVLARKRRRIEGDEDDETERLRKFKADVGEDETEMLPIKLKSGELVRLKKKIEPLQEEENDEPSDNQTQLEAKTKVEEEDFSHLPASELLAKRRELLEDLRGKIASAAQALTTNPQEHYPRLRELYRMSAGEQVHSMVREPIQKLAIASLVQSFVDIIPGYPIRELTDPEKQQKMKKETKKLLDYEQTLLRYYVKYLQLLEKNAMKIAKSDQRRFDESTFTHKLAMLSAKCLSRLLTNAPHFNYSTNIITCLTRLALSNYKPLVDEACASLREMFKNDTIFKISLHAAKTIATMVNKKKGYVSPQLIGTFLSLKIREVDRGEKKDETRALKTKKFKLQKERKSKSARKYEKQLKKLESDLKEAEAAESMSTKLKYATETLKHVFATYFRVIKRMPTTHLLEPVLAGLSKFAHLINVEFFDDLITSLGELVDQQHLKTVDSLHCVKTIFVILSGEGQALNIDPFKFYKSAYSRMTAIPFQKDKDTQFQEVRLVIECLDFMLNKRKKLVSLLRVAAFIKRILVLTFFLSTKQVIALLAAMRTYFITHPRLATLVEDDSEAVANGIFHPDYNDPDVSNALSSCIVEELTIFSKNQERAIASFALNILHKIPSSGNFHLKPQWSTIPPQDWLTTELIEDRPSQYTNKIYDFAKKHKITLSSKNIGSTVTNWMLTVK